MRRVRTRVRVRVRVRVTEFKVQPNDNAYFKYQ